MKKRKFGSGGMPSIEESMKSGNRVSRQVGEETKRMMPPKRRSGMPSIEESMKSGNRMSKENAKDAAAVKKYAKGGKIKKRYDEGGMAGAGVDLEAAARRGENLRELDRMDFSVPKVKAPDKKQSFSAAFAAARKRGDKTFTWNGGSYGTKMKGEGNAPKTTPRAPAIRSAPEDKEIVVTGKRPSKPTSDAVSRTGVGSAINRGVGAINDQMSTQARNMAKLRKENPDIFTRMMRGSEKKADSSAARKDFDTKASKAGIGVMLERPPRNLKYAKGGKVAKRADGVAKQGKTATKMVKMTKGKMR